MRAATPADAAEVAGVHVRAWQAGYRGILPDEYLDELRVEDRMQRYTFGDTRPDRPATTLAVVDGRVVGFATVGPCRDQDASEAGEVYAVHIDPSMWRQGIGSALLTRARTRLRERGFAEALLWVLAANERARHLYRSDGWQHDGHRCAYRIGETSLEAVRYHHALSDLSERHRRRH